MILVVNVIQRMSANAQLLSVEILRIISAKQKDGKYQIKLKLTLINGEKAKKVK